MNKDKEQVDGVAEWSKCWICGRTAEQVENDVRVLIRTPMEDINNDIADVEDEHRISINVRPEYLSINILQHKTGSKWWSSIEKRDIAVPLCVICDEIFSSRSQRTIDQIEEIGYLKDGSVCKIVTNELD